MCVVRMMNEHGQNIYSLLTLSVEHRVRFLKFRFLRFCAAVSAAFINLICMEVCVYEMLRALQI